MKFGERVRELRQKRNLTQRDLGAQVSVEFSYISKIENGKLDFGDYPSERLIERLADAMGVETDELLLLAEKVPPQIKQRVMDRPDAFRKFAQLDDEALDELVEQVDENSRRKGKKPK
jgi:transcriptional regulator with XRE-family HTH domain